MKTSFVILLSFVVFTANAQVKLLSMSQLQQRLAKGKDTTYVVNFWATWCGPCVEELPHFEQIQLENKDKPFKVILVSLDFKSKLKSDVIPFVAKQKIKSEVYVINEPDEQAFIEKVDPKWSGSIPATLFINGQRQIKVFYERPFAAYKELVSKLESLKLTP